MKNYLSVVYDLTGFGIYNIKNAIVNSDMDDGITIDVSFNGGSTFIKGVELNKKFSVPKSTGKIQTKINFNDSTSSDIYTVRTKGVFTNLEIGTTIYFTNINTPKTFSTNIGPSGVYSINLPRGNYSVWYKSSRGDKIELIPSFNPETRTNTSTGVDKENTIELFSNSIEWVKYSVFDTFSDTKKMLNGSCIIDPDGNLSDGITNRKVRYWAIGFE